MEKLLPPLSFATIQKGTQFIPNKFTESDSMEESRQYHAERTIHIEFKADFTGSQRIIRLRDRDAAPCSRVRTGKMNIPC